MKNSPRKPVSVGSVEVLSPQLSGAEVIREATGEIVKLQAELLISARTSLQTAIEIGGLLVTIRENIPHGQWRRHVAENFQFSDQTARNRVKLFEHRDDPRFKTFLNLTLSEAYRLLAPPSSPGALKPLDSKRKTSSASSLDRLKKWWEMLGRGATGISAVDEDTRTRITL